MGNFAFFIVLLVALVLGFSDVLNLQEVAANSLVRGGIVATILFLTAVTIDVHDFRSLLKRPLVIVVAFGLSFGALPLIALLIGSLYSTDLRIGFLAMAAAPATMSSATVWTGQANGNRALSLAISMLSNSLCFLLTPLCLAACVELPAGQAVEVKQLMINLLLLVIVPISAAQLARRAAAVPQWCRRNRQGIARVVQIGVLIMVLLGSTVTSQRMGESSSSTSIWMLLGVTAGVLLFRGSALLVGMIVTRSLQLPKRDAIAVTIAGTQKTLVVGLQVGMDLGCSILPIIGYHIAQLTMDTLYAGKVRVVDVVDEDGNLADHKRT